MTTSHARRLEAMMADGSLRRLKELTDAGVPAMTVRRAVAAGSIEAVSRGVYRQANLPRPRHAELAEVAARVSGALICLKSAAYYNGLTTEAPPAVDIALGPSRRVPTLDRPAIDHIRWSDPKELRVGVDEHVILGVPVRVTDPSRTVVDLLRFRDRVTTDLAIDCLRDYTLAGFALEELVDTADVLGCWEDISPYLACADRMLVRRP